MRDFFLLDYVLTDNKSAEQLARVIADALQVNVEEQEDFYRIDYFILTKKGRLIFDSRADAQEVETAFFATDRADYAVKNKGRFAKGNSEVDLLHAVP